MDKILILSYHLRKSGIPVSIRSTEIAYKTKELLEYYDDDTLKTALKTVYIKDRSQLNRFNKIYDELFSKEEASEEKSKQRRGIFRSTAISNKLRIRKSKPKAQIDKSYLDLSGIPSLDDHKNIEENDDILNRDITRLNAYAPEIFDLCQKLGKKIANKRSRRKKLSKKFKPDIRKTIRKNLKYGGVPIELVRMKPKIRKNEHVFLCDVSGSCEWISTWFFLILYSARSSFNKSKTFDFDNKTIDTTEALDEKEIANAFINVRLMRQRNLMIHGRSNMYTAFKEFDEKAKITKKSYVIILSDCRDWAGPKEDGKPKSAEVLRGIAKKAKRVLILNPEPRDKWNIADSCVSDYEASGAQFFEVRTLEQLANFILQL